MLVINAVLYKSEHKGEENYFVAESFEINQVSIEDDREKTIGGLQEVI